MAAAGCSLVAPCALGAAGALALEGLHRAEGVGQLRHEGRIGLGLLLVKLRLLSGLGLSCRERRHCRLALHLHHSRVALIADPRGRRRRGGGRCAIAERRTAGVRVMRVDQVLDSKGLLLGPGVQGRGPGLVDVVEGEVRARLWPAGAGRGPGWRCGGHGSGRGCRRCSRGASVRRRLGVSQGGCWCRSLGSSGTDHYCGGHGLGRGCRSCVWRARGPCSRRVGGCGSPHSLGSAGPCRATHRAIRHTHACS